MSKADKRPITRDKLDKGDKGDKGAKAARPDSAAGTVLNQSKTGTFIFRDGSRYEGEYKEMEGGINVRSGMGKYTCGVTRSMYTGSWDQDRMNGKGRLEFASGAFYEGMWKDNQYCGPGTYKWPDGSQFIGEWHENGMNGPGKYCDATGQGWIGSVYKGGPATLAPELV
ncbi:hypothetical protein BC831DRAFT_453746 [Entophlyctis helioformis]|nr:hypothetical protein BC831DRAFT_453746 [Entophlyctis helioformis]